MGKGLRISCKRSVAKTARHIAVTWLVMLAGLAVYSSSALALSQRGHVFGFSFDHAAAGALSSVAVDEETQVAYVVNHATKVVEPFAVDAEGKTAEAQASFAVPSPEAIAVDNSHNPEDPSRNDVYVSSTKVLAEVAKGAIFKFENGVQIAKITKFQTPAGELQTLGRISGLAVGSGGTLWVSGEVEGEQVVDRVSDAPPNAGVAKLLFPPGETGGGLTIAPGLALESAEHTFYVGHTEEETEEELEKEAEEKTKASPCTVRRCTTASFSFGAEGIEQLAEELVSGNTTSVAVNDLGEGVFANDIFLDQATGVTVLSSSGALVQRFGESEGGFTGLQEGRGIAVASTAGEAAAGDVFVTDAKAGQVDVFVPAPPGPPAIDSTSVAGVTAGSVELKAAIDPGGAKTEYRFEYSAGPSVDCAPVVLSPCETPTGTISAGFGDQPIAEKIGGLQPGVEYRYRVLASNAHGVVMSEEGTFTTRAPTPSELVLPDGRNWELVSPADKHGAAIESITKLGAPIQAAANGDAITYVSDAPTEAQPEGNRNIEPTQVLSTRNSNEWSSKDIATPGETVAGVSGQIERSEYTLFSKGLSLGLVYPPNGAGEHQGPLAEPALSPALESGELLEMTPYIRSDAPLAPEPGANANIYEMAQKNSEVMGRGAKAPGYVALVNHKDDNTGKPFGKQVRAIENATPDLTHVVFGSSTPLTESDKSAGLYEWSDGSLPEGGDLQFISILPNGSPTLSASLGGPSGIVSRNAISNDGTHVFWTSGPALFMRDTAKQQTVELSAQEKGVPIGLNEKALPEYQMASANGKEVLFTDQQRLLEGSGASEGKKDLYECEMVEEEGHDKCKLSDRTATFEGNSAEVLGELMGATESDLSRVYFVANGVLSNNENANKERATQGDCTKFNLAPPIGASCNLYVSEAEPAHNGHYQTRFIARVASEDGPDWEGDEGNLGEVTSRVSPNGQYLAFMSDRSLTGYDNSDVNSGHADEEVFLYNAAAKPGTRSLVCASCNPTGARPTGVFDPAESSGEEQLLIDHREIWSAALVGVDHWLAGAVPGWTPVTLQRAIYQSRYLSNDGRLFFDSSDALVGQDTNGKMDVYEYESPGAGGARGCSTSSTTFSAHQEGCIALISSGTSNTESAFLDASEEGGDVFFLTSARLVPQLDTDAAYDIYDAHECTSESPCTVPPTSSSSTCGSEESCKQGASRPPNFAVPTSTAFSGAGNLVPTQAALGVKTTAKRPTRAQLLAKALKVCRRNKHRAKRITCERRARHNYGAKSAKKAKSSEHGVRRNSR